MNILPRNRLITVGLLIISSIAQVKAQKNIQTKPALDKSFLLPPDSVKPSVYWYWLNDNISKQGVIKDLDAMAKIGIGRAFIGNIGLEKESLAYGKVKIFSKEWLSVTKTAIETAGKKGIDIGLFNSPGWSQSGGPWVKPQQSMRYLAATEVEVRGPQQYDQELPRPAATVFQDVKVLAFRKQAGVTGISQKVSSYSSVPAINNIATFFDSDTATSAIFYLAKDGKSNTTIDISYTSPITARSLVIYPAKTPFKARVVLQVKEQEGYREIKSFEIDRSNPSNIVGFIPYGPVAVSFPSTAASRFRLVVTSLGGSKLGFAEIKLSGTPVVERYIEKQLGKMFQTPLPLWNEYQWPRQNEPGDTSLSIDPQQVIDLTNTLTPDGKIRWNIPAGNWTIIRYSMITTGVVNAPASIEGQGLEIDKMNQDAVKMHFKAFIGKLLNEIPASDRKALKYVVADSYETGSQNWTDGLDTAFRKRYGYDPLPWLPVLTGRVVGSEDASDRFLWDLRRLVADKVAYDYVGTLRKLSNSHNMKLWLENYGHWGFPAEFLQYGGQADEVAGEFWNERDLGTVELKAASSSAHIYGKTKVSAESFTSSGLTYARHPLLLKAKADWSFTEGINNTLLHVYIHQPYDDKNPGINAWFGTEFNRKNTWFTEGKAFVDYLRRCNFMLQQGLPVNDIAYFIGEDAPKMTGIKNPSLPPGYQFDYINAEVIETRMKVENGRCVLPNGMSYRVLVLPPLTTMRPELLKKIRQLVKDGAVVVGDAPTRSPSLQNYPAADKEVKTIAAEIWGTAFATAGKQQYGKGVVYSPENFTSVLHDIGLVPDFTADNQDSVLYCHRKNGEEDIYFVTNQSHASVSIDALFRVNQKQPEWWDPVSGNVRELPQFNMSAPGITVPLRLEPLQSGFVIFRNKLKNKSEQGADNFPRAQTIQTLSGEWRVTFDTAMQGITKPLTLDRLQDWSKSDNDSIKNYSGRAIYTKTFKLESPIAQDRIYLDVGKIGVMAKVIVNGKEAGTVWTAPWRTDITGLLTPGNNKLEIVVVNTWVNRLIGDAKLPPGQRKTWLTHDDFKAGSSYQASGLIGPVTIQKIRY